MKLNNIAINISIILGTLLITSHKVEAGSYSISGRDSFGSGNGQLSFDQSPLTGIGHESVKFNQLQNASFNFSYSGYVPGISNIGSSLHYQNTGTDDTVFEFHEGSLAGIIEPPRAAGGTNGFFYLGMSGGITVNVGFTFSLDGNHYSIVGDGTVTHAGFNVSTNSFYNYTFSIDENEVGELDFTMIVPLVSVPEPLTILGSLTALGLGIIFKRKVALK
jgi:hypothetical protein